MSWTLPGVTVLAGILLTSLLGCAGPGPGAGSGTGTGSGSEAAPTTGAGAGPGGAGGTASSSGSGTASGPASGPPRAGPPPSGPLPPGPSPTTAGPGATGPGATASCVERIVAQLSPRQAVGQLVMSGIQAGQGPGAADELIAEEHLGGVVLLGGRWGGAEQVRAVTTHVQAQATQASTSGLRLLVAADQEGGEVEQLRGEGFTPRPPALDQGRQAVTTILADAARTGRELAAAGVNVDLAPVADTVPAGLGRANAPIGRYARQYGSDPATVSRGVTAVVEGLRSARVAATVKHFPGLGRVTGNTDVTATGITDATTSATDPYLEPFRAGIRAGARLVMVSSARYPRLDPDNQAVFSSRVVTDLLRGALGYQGVVVTDDVGVASSVTAVPASDRATRFVAAGGDIVLTADPRTVPVMTAAIADRATRDAAFAAQVGAAVRRVVSLKVELGLAPCP